MELALDVKLDIKEQLVQRVFLFFFSLEIYIDFPFLNLLADFRQGLCKKDYRFMLTESLSSPFTVSQLLWSFVDHCPFTDFPKNKWTYLHQNLYVESTWGEDEK